MRKLTKLLQAWNEATAASDASPDDEILRNMRDVAASDYAMACKADENRMISAVNVHPNRVTLCRWASHFRSAKALAARGMRWHADCM